MTAVSTRYDEVPYTRHAYPGSHPDRLACMARLFGMTPPDPRSARVLELGCAAGGNLIPLAWALPEARLVGVDLARSQIEKGLEVVTDLGLEDRVTLHHMDLVDIDASLGTFDYILCHGTWSWVSEEVQRRIFEILRDHLAPRGVAYVSYNTLPGWHLRGMIRDMMLYHVEGFDTPREKVEQAQALLEFLAEASPAHLPHGVALRQEAELLRGLSRTYLYHDHLADQNEPVYFHRFARRAQDHSLQYLSEPDLSEMVVERLPEKVREILRRVGGGSLVREQQYLDFLRNTTFRRSLLVHADVALERRMDWEKMVGLHLAVKGQVTHDPFAADEPYALTWDDQTITTGNPLLGKALGLLAGAWPRTLSFEQVLAGAMERAPVAAGVDAARQDLGANLFTCHVHGAVEAHAIPLPVTGVTDRPRVFPLARYQANRGEDVLTNLRHRSGRASTLPLEVARWADGTRTRSELVDKLVEAAEQGRITVRLEDASGDGPIAREAIREAFEAAIDGALESLAAHSLLMDT